MHNINTTLFTLIYQGAGYYPLLDRFFILLTAYVAYGVVLLVIFYFCVIRPRQVSDPLVRARRYGAGGEVALAALVTWMIVHVLKIFVAFPRPFVALMHVTPLVSAVPYESFPSGHAAVTMAIAIAVLPYRRHFGHLLIAFSLVVSLSRLFVGVHYPLDVGTGLLIGYLVPKLLHAAFRGGVKHA